MACSQLSSSDFAADGTSVVTLSGDWGLEGSRHAEQRLLEALEAGGANVVVDLSDVTFVDWGLIRALVRGSRAARGAGRKFAVVKPGSPACRVFELAGMDRQLGGLASLSEAVCDVAPDQDPNWTAEPPGRGEAGEAADEWARLLAGFRGLREELEGVARRARETRVKLAHGEATSGATGIIDIENRCRDALAALHETVPEFAGEPPRVVAALRPRPPRPAPSAARPGRRGGAR